MACGTYAVIPVKPFASSKRRLSPILNSTERQFLARHMLRDVLDSALAARSLAGVYVITCDDEVAAIAEETGARTIREDAEFGLDRAVGTAVAALAGIAGGIVVIPADIPHLTAEAIDAIVASTPDRGIGLTPAVYDGGTNLLSMRPGGLIPPLFGPGSFQRHYRAARRAGAAAHIHVCPLAGHDLDRPRDIEPFLAFSSPTRTQDYLSRLGIRERLQAIGRSFAPADLARAFA
jgi:2-phospho-L-lactate guanylyltransferase